MVIMNTGMAVPILSRPMAEFVILGKVTSPVHVDHFLSGPSRTIAEKKVYNSNFQVIYIYDITVFNNSLRQSDAYASVGVLGPHWFR